MNYTHQCPRGHRWNPSAGSAGNVCAACGWSRDELPEWEPDTSKRTSPEAIADAAASAKCVRDAVERDINVKFSFPVRTAVERFSTDSLSEFTETGTTATSYYVDAKIDGNTHRIGWVRKIRGEWSAFRLLPCGDTRRLPSERKREHAADSLYDDYGVFAEEFTS